VLLRFRPDPSRSERTVPALVRSFARWHRAIIRDAALTFSELRGRAAQGPGPSGFRLARRVGTISTRSARRASYPGARTSGIYHSSGPRNY
jgi:hypothetical protein